MFIVLSIHFLGCHSSYEKKGKNNKKEVLEGNINVAGGKKFPKLTKSMTSSLYFEIRESIT